MVWGMSMPSGFGEFWPDGDFEGVDKNGKTLWGERLRLYYLEQTAEEQRRLFDYGDNHAGYGAGTYAYYVSEKLKREIGTRGSPDLPPFSPVEPHEPPQSLVTVKRYEALGSLIELNDRLVAVDEALKAIVERLEPGVHQFFPIEIRMPKGKVYPEQYYTLVIGQFFESFSPENSKEDSWRADGPNYYFFRDSSKGISELALSKEIFGKAHLWRERRMSSQLNCFSDNFQHEIAKAGLRIPKHYRMMEI